VRLPPVDRNGVPRADGSALFASDEDRIHGFDTSKVRARLRQAAWRRRGRAGVHHALRARSWT